MLFGDKIYENVKTNNMQPPTGFKGGTTYSNDGRGGTAIINSEYSHYLEYDVHPYTPGISRGPERIVIGFDDCSIRAWYTPNHYKTSFEVHL